MITLIIAETTDSFGFHNYEDWHRFLVALSLTLVFWGLTRNFWDRWEVVSKRVGREQYLHYVVGIAVFVVATLVNWGKGVDLQWPNFLFLAWCLWGVRTSWITEPHVTKRYRDRKERGNHG